MKIGGSCSSIALTCIGEVWVRRTTSSGPGGSAARDLGSRRGRRRLDAQVGVQAVRVDVEGVLRQPRRVPGRVVQGREVVVVQLDLGALHDPVAKPDEDVLDLAQGSDQQVARTDRHRRGAGQGHVDRVGREAVRELGSLELRPPAREQLLQRLPGLVSGRADGAPLLGRQPGDPPQDPGQLGLAAQVANPQLLQLGDVRRGADRRLGIAAKLRRFSPGRQA